MPPKGHGKHAWTTEEGRRCTGCGPPRPFRPAPWPTRPRRGPRKVVGRRCVSMTAGRKKCENRPASMASGVATCGAVAYPTRAQTLSHASRVHLHPAAPDQGAVASASGRQPGLAASGVHLDQPSRLVHERADLAGRSGALLPEESACASPPSRDTQQPQGSAPTELESLVPAASSVRGQTRRAAGRRIAEPHYRELLAFITSDRPTSSRTQIGVSGWALRHVLHRWAFSPRRCQDARQRRPTPM